VSESAAPNLRVVLRHELEAGEIYRQWDDPKQLARPTAQKRAAILSNPFSGPDDPAQIIGLIGNRVVGRMDLLPGQLSLRGAPTRILYASMLFVEEEFRHTGIGLMILMKIAALNPIVGACGISQMIAPVYEKLRWTNFALPRMVLVRRSRAVIETKIKSKLLARIVAAVVDTGLALQRLVLWTILAVRARGLRLEEAPTMPAAFEDLLKPRSDEIAPIHSIAWYNWLLANRFDDSPKLRRRLMIVSDWANKPVAFFLVRSRFYESATQRQLRNITFGSVQDWKIFEPGAISLFMLVVLAVKTLCKDCSDAVEIPTFEPGLMVSLKRFVFLQVGSLNFLFRGAPGSALADKSLHDPSLWSIKPADGDNFFS
jgi:hypothetical protein